MTEQEQQELIDIWRAMSDADRVWFQTISRGLGVAADRIETLTRERDEARRDAVPREPTEAMIDAAFHVRLNTEMVGGQVAAAWWRAMYDAALSSLTPGGEG